MAPVNSLVCNTGPNVINNGHYVLCWVCSEALTVATVKSYFGHLPLCDVTLSSFYLSFVIELNLSLIFNNNKNFK